MLEMEVLCRMQSWPTPPMRLMASLEEITNSSSIYLYVNIEPELAALGCRFDDGKCFPTPLGHNSVGTSTA